jgi:hypothetical protein
MQLINIFNVCTVHQRVTGEGAHHVVHSAMFNPCFFYCRLKRMLYVVNWIAVEHNNL